MQKPETNNQILPPGVSPMDNKIKYNIQGDIKTLLERDCKVEIVMKFLKDIKMFEEI